MPGPCPSWRTCTTGRNAGTRTASASTSCARPSTAAGAASTSGRWSGDTETWPADDPGLSLHGVPPASPAAPGFRPGRGRARFAIRDRSAPARPGVDRPSSAPAGRASPPSCAPWPCCLPTPAPSSPGPGTTFFPTPSGTAPGSSTCTRSRPSFRGTVRENLALPGTLKINRGQTGRARNLGPASGGFRSARGNPGTADGGAFGRREAAPGPGVRALTLEPDFLLLDEPTSAMDVATESATLATLRHLSDRCGIIMVTHSVEAINSSDRVLLLADGRLTETAPPLDRETVRRLVGPGGSGHGSGKWIRQWFRKWREQLAWQGIPQTRRGPDGQHGGHRPVVHAGLLSHGGRASSPSSPACAWTCPATW